MKQIQGILRELFDEPGIVISRETVAADIPGWDSLSHTLLILTIENHMGIRFGGEHEFADVGELLDRIDVLSSNQ